MQQDVKELLRNFIKSDLLFDRHLPGDDEDLFVSGALDSLALFTLVLFLNNKFAVTFKMSELRAENFLTINAIAAQVQKKLQESQG